MTKRTRRIRKQGKVLGKVTGPLGTDTVEPKEQPTVELSGTVLLGSVKVAKGITRSAGDAFEYNRLDVEVMLPCEADEDSLRKTFTSATDYANEFLEEMMDEWDIEG